MIDTLILALWFFLPAGIANASPVFANKIPLLNRWRTPLDFGTSYGGKRMLGDNKTWRGVVFGTLMGALTGWIIFLIYPDSATLLWGISSNPALFMAGLGGLLGAGALFGDAVESFFKRQKGVPAGHSWFPFDQLDYIIGGLLFSLPLVQLSASTYLVIIVSWFGLHLISAYIGFLLKLKDKPI